MMDWNKLPPGTLAIKMPPGPPSEQDTAMLRELFAIAIKYGIAMIAETSMRTEPELNKKVVTVAQYQAFVLKYDKMPDKRWYRFGQAFYNEMVPAGFPPHPDLFHCTNRQKAAEIIWDTYIIGAVMPPFNMLCTPL